jgi:hypothetical protein
MASFHSEHEIQQRIRLACGRGTVRLWRNNTGALVDQQGRFVRCGGCSPPGSTTGVGAAPRDAGRCSGTWRTWRRPSLAAAGGICSTESQNRT